MVSGLLERCFSGKEVEFEHGVMTEPCLDVRMSFCPSTVCALTC